MERPSAPGGPARAALYLVNDLERLEGLTTRLERSGEVAGPDCGPAAAMIAGCAAALSDRSRSMTASLDHAQRRLFANLTLRSVHARDALRVGPGLAGACALAGGFGLAHGSWVAFATLTVLRSSLRVTARRVGAAIAGTVRGARAELPDAVGDLVRAAGGYLAATVRSLASGTIPQLTVSADLDRVRRPALAAAVRVDETFAQYLAEGPRSEEASVWAAAAAAAQRLRYAADLLRASDGRPTADPRNLDAAADRVLGMGGCREHTQGSPHHPPGDPLLDWLNDLSTPFVSPTTEAIT